MVWAEPAGVGSWLTERAPLGDLAPVVVGVGFAHRIGPARLAWRAHFFSAAGGRPIRFLFVDLVSVEQVLAVGGVRPYWRAAVALALDLEGARRGLGSEGFFNADNGASGGFGLAHGWGADVFVAGPWFVRGEATVRFHAGAGRYGVLGGAHLGLGRTL